eukprot:5151163-Pyramimonas_sp.AAC.1
MYSPAFQDAREALFGFADDPECCVAWEFRPWWKSSILKNMIDNFRVLSDIPSIPTYEMPLQKKVEKYMHMVDPLDIHGTVSRRL